MLVLIVGDYYVSKWAKMSKGGVDFYSGRMDQRRALRDALVGLNNARTSDQKVANLMRRYLEDGKVPNFPKAKNPPTRATIQRMRVAANEELDRAHASTIGPLYNFLCVCEELTSSLYNRTVRIHSAHKLAPLLEAVQHNMGAVDGPLDNRKLKSLEGTFYLFRKAWTSPYAESYVRCVLRFDWVGDALFYSEEQKFFDTVEKLPTDELDNGIVVPFGMNVVLLGRGQDKDLLKFFSFHDFTPYPDGHQHVHRMSGNFIAVYSKGPHPGFGAYARRVEEEEGEPTCAFYAPGELDEETIFRITNASIGGPSTVGWRK